LGDTKTRLSPVKVENTTSDYVEAGDKVTFSIKNQTLWVCGFNTFWTLGLPSVPSIPLLTRIDLLAGRIKEVQSASRSSVVLTTNGELYGTGVNINGAFGLNEIDTLTNWTKLPVDRVSAYSISRLQLLVLTYDGILYGSGYNGVIERKK
jgi:alpha-tubulin suppressor-like RCC1 family protein